jgi:hypothetical protein
MKFLIGDEVIVLRTGKTHRVFWARTRGALTENFYALDNGTYYWEHELKSKTEEQKG